MAGESPALAARNAADADAEAPRVTSPVGVRNLSLTILAVIAVTFTLQHAQDFFIPLVLSVLVSYALDPIVTWLASRRIPRALSAAVVILALTTGAGYGVYALRGQATAILDRLPEAAARLRTIVARHRAADSPINQVQKAATAIERTATEASTPTPAPRGVTRVQIEQPPLNLREYLWWGSAGAVALIGQLVAVLFLVYFQLVSGDLFKRKLVRISGPTLTRKKVTVQILDEINVQIERFLLVQAFTSAVVGVASWLVFRWLGLEQPAVWGVLAGVFNSIPYFGPVVVTGGVFVLGFLQWGTLEMALAVAAAALVITSLEGFLLTPWLTSRAARMNAVAIFVGLLFWSWVWGLWGTLLAVPMLMVVKAVADRVEDLHAVSELLGD
jgi:predicted PurR-regulated permease PerM